MKLPITLCAVDHAAHALTRLALQRCLDACDFADVLICSDQDILPGARHVQTSCHSRDQAEIILDYVLPDHVRTEHYLYVQWDSWIINADSWDPDFLNYDWVGAPWPDRYLWDGCDPAHNVGNGGFSLRSVKLAMAARQLKLYSPEDHAICVDFRPGLEAAGCRWPTADVAARFSAELEWPAEPTFGFHGAFRFASVLSPDEFDDLVGYSTPYVRTTSGWRHLQRYLDLVRSGGAQPPWAGPMKDGWMQRLKAA